VSWFDKKGCSLAALWVAGAVLILGIGMTVACLDFFKIDVAGPTQSQHQGPAASPSPSPVPPNCEVLNVAVTRLGGTTLIALNVDVTLDATPRGAGGPITQPPCALQPVSWELSGTAACSLSDSGSYNPVIRCTAAGSITATANVGGHIGAGTFRVGG